MNLISRTTALSMLVTALAISAFAQTTEFTYQGSLQSSSAPASGNFDFEFALFDSLTGGLQLGSTLTRSSVAVANGTFVVNLDFGGQFPGGNRFLEIRVRTTGGGAYTLLSPRQPVSSSPYSVRSLNATNAATATTATNATQLGGIAADQYVITTDPRMSNARSPLPGSSNYIQNGGIQASSNFNISGIGSASVFNARTQFNIDGNRVLTATDIGNTIAGISAGQSNTTGNFNTFVGGASGFFNTTGGQNSFFGSSAGQGNNGEANSFFGVSSGLNNSTGSFNSFFGRRSGTGNSTGTRNTLIGYEADVNSGDLTNASAIGAHASVNRSNSIVLGSVAGVNGGLANTHVGIGINSPNYPLSVIGSAGNGADQGIAEFSSDVNDAGVRIRNFAANGRIWALFSSGGTTGLCAGCFSIYDATQGQARLTINASGNVGISALGAAGSTALCLNGSNQFSTCSSSERYKDNVAIFTLGLDLIRKLRPVSFNWKHGGMADMGLVAEEVNAVEPLLTSTNSKGEVEGVKYDRVGVVLVNAVKEQQAQIEAQAKQIEQQRAEIEALKALVCSQNPGAAICVPKN
ncbi:MAG: tail fiber domain-containing protein [Pyrinomonadaceae bacterium]|nr:tail fiber domain-containing protein [Pyrinomonadaceae bacterium]MBP6211414.1 tail fiber domain-containing protein [Pyrinomonadaceae bacterium]